MTTDVLEQQLSLEQATTAAEASSQETDAPNRPVRLGEQLVGANLITEQELEAALALQSKDGQRIGEALLELGLIDEDQLAPFIEAKLGVPSVVLREGLVDPEVVALIPKSTADRLGVVAMFKLRGTLTVAMDDPQNLLHIDQLERVTGLRIRPVFAFARSIRRILERCYSQDYVVDAVTADLDEYAVEIQSDTIDSDINAIEKLVEGSPVINLVNYLILQSLRKGASDIHIEPSRKYSVVRFRVDGQLQEMLRPRRDVHNAVVSRIKVMGKMDIAEHHMPQDGRCQVMVEGKEVDLRISTLPTVLGEKVVIRVLDKQRLSFDLERLGIPGATLAEVKQLLTKPYGLVLVTGPTGSGKTTTLYSALELIKSVHRNIVTVEEPVEYQIDLVNQVQVESSRQVTFANVLRSILRQDPDVIMVGEIRDADTAKVAVQAALTGHLVLSTLHTNDAAGAITRLVDMGIETYKVAAAVNGVIAQRLVRKVCPKCATSYYPRAEFLQTLRYTGDSKRTFLRGEGCRACFDTGFQGRTGIYEVITLAPELRGIVSSGATLEDVRRWCIDSGMSTLLEGGLRLAEKEVTSLEEIARVVFVD